MTDTLRGPQALIVEDSLEIRELLGRTLERIGFEVVEVADGPAALEHLSKHIPAIILLDLMLPGLSGLQVLAQIRAHRKFRSVPVLVVTGTMTFDRDLETAGATAVLRKPFEPHVVVTTVRALVATSGFSASARD